MTTLERPHEEIGAPITAPPERRSSGRLLIAVLAVAALLLGGIVGWIVRGDGAGEPDVLLAGDGDITARQEQMLDIVRDSAQAWRDGDVDAVLASFAPTGTFEAFGNVYRVDDGSFAAYIESGTWTSLEVHEPMLVRGNELFTFHRYGGGELSELFTFTEAGEPLITSHVIHTDGQRSDRAAPATAGIVLAGGGELTARQERMLDHVRSSAQAWRDGDVDAVLAGFTPDGTFEAFGNVYRVDDGSFAAYIGQASWTSLDVQEPVLLRGNEVFTFHRVRGQDLSEMFTFTETGELLITSHVIHTGEPAAGSTGAPAILLTGEGELTARHGQMVDFLREYEKAWIDGDVEALRAMYTDEGRFTALGTEYRVDEDGFATFVGSGRRIEVLEPTLVNGSRMMLFHIHSGSTLRDLMRFTTDGELLLVSHEIVS